MIVCRYCHQDANEWIRVSDLTPRTIGLRFVDGEDGDYPAGLGRSADLRTMEHDESSWEGSETIGFCCENDACPVAFQDFGSLAELVTDDAAPEPPLEDPEPATTVRVLFAELFGLVRPAWATPDAPWGADVDQIQAFLERWEVRLGGQPAAAEDPGPVPPESGTDALAPNQALNRMHPANLRGQDESPEEALRRLAPDLLEVADPFASEAARHGDTGSGLDGATRDRLRQRTDCPRCVALVAALDAELSRALIAGTGPWAGLG